MQAKTFSAALAQIRFGELESELTKELRRLVIAVQETGKVGSLTLNIKLRPGKHGGPMDISDDLKVAMPKADRGSTLMYPTAEGNLQRNDPRQGELEGMRIVSKQKDGVRVGTDAGPQSAAS